MVTELYKIRQLRFKKRIKFMYTTLRTSSRCGILRYESNIVGYTVFAS